MAKYWRTSFSRRAKSLSTGCLSWDLLRLTRYGSAGSGWNIGIYFCVRNLEYYIFLYTMYFIKSKLLISDEEWIIYIYLLIVEMNAFRFKIVASEIIRRTNLVLFTVKINHRTNSQISPMPIRPFSMQRLIIWGIFGSWNSMSLQQKSLIKTRILREKSSSQLVCIISMINIRQCGIMQSFQYWKSTVENLNYMCYVP